MAWRFRDPNERTIAGAHAERASLIEILDVNQLQFTSNEFNNQVEELLSFIRLSREQVLNMSQLYNDLEQTLSEIWPGCKVHAFGSIVTGLAIKTSDSDCFIQLPEGVTETPKGCVVYARRLLDHYPHKFQKTFVILHARVPIVQFYYKPLNIHCDVSFSAITGPTNSNLIGILLSLDKRALQLAIILKYWSKVHYLTGTNLVPNYAFILMIIMYLQHQKILPPLKPYINNSFVIGVWDYGYDSAALRNYRIDNDMSLLDLLIGFFVYYRDFEYEKYVISPYLGYPLERECFMGKKKQVVPDVFPQYAELRMREACTHLSVRGLMCIQDIFEHDRNCSIVVRDKLYTKFTVFTTNAANISNKYFQEDNWSPYLIDLFTNVPERFADTFKFMPRKRFNKFESPRKIAKRKEKKEKQKIKMAEKVKLKREMKKALKKNKAK